MVGGEVMKNYFKYLLSICFIIGLCLHSEFVFAESLKGNALKQGDCIGIVAPASGIEDMNIADAINKLQNWGYKVKLSPNLYQQSGYLAGSDQMRADDLNNFFADDEVDAILCLRGGYGSGRILDLLNYEMIKQHPKMVIGYSDITALHMALIKKADLVPVHGAMVIDINDNGYNYTDNQLKLGLANESLGANNEFVLPSNHKLKVLKEGYAKGKIIGGNLSVLASLCGSEYQPNGENCILFIEEVGEDSYVIDRCFQQLWQSGVLKQVKGLIIGNMRRCEPTEPTQFDYYVMQVIKQYADKANIPVVYDMPVGHGAINGFLPLNVEITLDANTANPQIIFNESYVK